MALFDKQSFALQMKLSSFVIKNLPERALNIAANNGFDYFVSLSLICAQNFLILAPSLLSWAKIGFAVLASFLYCRLQYHLVFH